MGAENIGGETGLNRFQPRDRLTLVVGTKRAALRVAGKEMPKRPLPIAEIVVGLAKGEMQIDALVDRQFVGSLRERLHFGQRVAVAHSLCKGELEIESCARREPNGGLDRRHAFVDAAKFDENRPFSAVRRRVAWLGFDDPVAVRKRLRDPDRAFEALWRDCKSRRHSQDAGRAPRRRRSSACS